MRKKIIIPLLCSLFLVACREPEIPTYTITINDAPHVNVSETSFTFKQNNFDPIVLSYTIDDYDYVVVNATANDDAATCKVDRQKSEIEIIPSKNMNFSITINVTHFSNVSLVRIKEADHFTPDEDKIVFANDDFSPINVSCEVDKYVSITPSVTKGTATCSFDSENSILTITPASNGLIEITITSTEEYRRVHFNPGEEGELGPYSDEYINIPFDHNWGGYVDTGRQTARFEDYGFKGWTFKNNPTLGEEVIPFDYRVTETTESEAYAVFEHKVNMTSESLAVEKEVYVEDSNEDATIQIYFRLRHKDERYDFPLESNRFTITNSDQSAITNFTYHKVGDATPMPYVEIKRSDIKTGSINIKVNDYQPEYTFAHADDPHLIYGVIEGKETPRKFEDFKFTITAKQDTNGPAYYVPDKIIVEVDGQRIAEASYKIEFADDKHQNATVTIYREKVLGDINVKATAAFEQAYHYQVTGYGVYVGEGQDSYQEGYQYYSEKGGKKLEIKLAEIPGFGDVDKHNIVIKVNDANWYTYDKFQEKYPGIATFDWEEPNKLIISPISGDALDIDSLSFHVISPKYSVFKNASWAELKEMCSAPAEYMTDMFVVGETKEVTIRNIKYELSIIDINKDSIAGQDNKKAALTIEFKNLICNDDGSTYKAKYSSYTIGNYDDEIYDNYLNNDFFEKLPIEMSDCIKTVKKQVHEQDPADDRKMTAKIFALSYEELGLNSDERQHKEGSPYAYYSEGDLAEKRIKYDINLNPTDYWTRSISQSGRRCDSVYIKSDGDSDLSDNFNKHAYMAAFCI